MKPSVGRTVHYQSYGDRTGVYPSACRAAVVTDVHPDAGGEVVDLCVLNPKGMFFDDQVSHDEDDKRGGTWHWPERVD